MMQPTSLPGTAASSTRLWQWRVAMPRSLSTSREICASPGLGVTTRTSVAGSLARDVPGLAGMVLQELASEVARHSRHDAFELDQGLAQLDHAGSDAHLANGALVVTGALLDDGNRLPDRALG